MKNLLLILLFCFTFQPLLAQQATKKEKEYTPKTLDEAIIQLKRLHNDSIKSIIISRSEDEFLAGTHLGLGMWIRNNWGKFRSNDTALIILLGNAKVSEI